MNNTGTIKRKVFFYKVEQLLTFRWLLNVIGHRGIAFLKRVRKFKKKNLMSSNKHEIWICGYCILECIFIWASIHFLNFLSFWIGNPCCHCVCWTQLNSWCGDPYQKYSVLSTQSSTSSFHIRFCGPTHSHKTVWVMECCWRFVPSCKLFIRCDIGLHVDIRMCQY